MTKMSTFFLTSASLISQSSLWVWMFGVFVKLANLMNLLIHFISTNQYSKEITQRR